MARASRGKRAEDSLCDLSIAYAIIALCESSLFRTEKGNEFSAKIVRQCKAHAQSQLRDYDARTAREAQNVG